jgi:hypothetical protein
VTWRDWFRPKKPPAPCDDLVLGTLTWSHELDGWSGACGGLAFTLACGRESPPPESVRAYARRILGKRAWLDEELAKARATAPRYLDRFRSEMEALEYGRLHFSTDHGREYIFAELGPGLNYRAWRLEFTGDVCAGIGFDS